MGAYPENAKTVTRERGELGTFRPPWASKDRLGVDSLDFFSSAASFVSSFSGCSYLGSIYIRRKLEAIEQGAAPLPTETEVRTRSRGSRRPTCFRPFFSLQAPL
jgi:hypothetical protein